MQRGQRRDAEAGAGIERRVVRQRHRLDRRQGDVFRRRAEGALPLAVPDPDPLADAAAIDALAHRLDRAGAVAVRDDAREGHGPGAAPGLPVGRVDARGGDADQHLARAGGGGGQLAMGQDLGPAVAVVPDGFHGSVSFVAGRMAGRGPRVKATSPRAAATSGSTRHCPRSSGRTACRGRGAG